MTACIFHHGQAVRDSKPPFRLTKRHDPVTKVIAVRTHRFIVDEHRHFHGSVGQVDAAVGNFSVEFLIDIQELPPIMTLM